MPDFLERAYLCKNIHLFLNDLLKLILYLPSRIDLWAYFYCGFSSVSEYLFKEDTYSWYFLELLGIPAGPKNQESNILRKE
jgi:hypothetical protein